jgi:uncharacterized delta-60 repeat protein
MGSERTSGGRVNRALARLTAAALVLLAFACASEQAAAEPCLREFPRSRNPASVTLRLASSGRLLVALCDRETERSAVVALDRAGRRVQGFGGDGTIGPWQSPFPPELTLDRAGRILVVTRQPDHGEFVLKRFLPDGRIDRSFGSRGTTIIPTDFGFSWPDSIKAFVQPEGRILVTYHGERHSCYPGESCEYRSEFLKVHRYTPRGRHLDKRSYFGEYWELGDVALTPQGGLVVVGNYAEGGSNLLHTRPDLKFVRRFGRYGTVSLERPPLGAERENLATAAAIALQPDGSIVVASEGEGALRRFTEYGKVDTGFGDGGRVLCPPSAVESYANGGEAFRFVSLTGDGDIIAGGGRKTCGVARYHGDGSPDTSFGASGLVNLKSHGLPQPEGFAVADDGSIAVAAWDLKRKVFVITRLTASGQLDSRFGARGTTVIRGVPR